MKNVDYGIAGVMRLFIAVLFVVNIKNGANLRERLNHQ